jgi:hypothetical protein
VLEWDFDDQTTQDDADKKMLNEAFTFATELGIDKWKISKAPWPSDIDWDNYFYDGHWILVWLKVALLNLFILLVVLVFATPTILWESLQKMSAVAELIDQA